MTSKKQEAQLNSFGRIFRVALFGESHGELIGVTIDGCPAGIEINPADMRADLLRRKTGASGSSARLESDLPQVISGVFEGFSTGAPITILFKNENVQSADYKAFIDHPRPGHADFTARTKFGAYNDYRGGGHLSARLTLGLTAAGVIAKKIIAPMHVEAKLQKAGCSEDIEAAINAALAAGDSIGGVVYCQVKAVPVGLGESFFDGVESLISHAIFSIPAVQAIEFGAGFGSANLRGSVMNDVLANADGATATNNSGGINGGISNGNPIEFFTAFHPAASIALPQETWHFGREKMDTLHIKGRHDTCLALRAAVLVEAATAIVLADLLLLHKALKPGTVKNGGTCG